MEFRAQELFKRRTLRSSGPDWLYAPLERTGADTNSDGTVLACYKERLNAPAGLGQHTPQAAGRIRPASAASSRGKAESQRQRPKTARQFRDTKTRARQSPAFMKGTESSKLKATSLQCMGLSLSARAHPSHTDAPNKLHHAAARLLEAQHSKHSKTNSSRSSRPQSAPLRGRTPASSSHLRYSTATPLPRCPFAQLQQAVQKDIHTLSMDHTLPKGRQEELHHTRPDGVMEFYDTPKAQRKKHATSKKTGFHDRRDSKKHCWDLYREVGKKRSEWQNGTWANSK